MTKVNLSTCLINFIRMKYFLLILISLLMIHSSKAQTRRALIIGIGSYPAEIGWSNIHGDNDVPIIFNALIKKNFNAKDIECLKNSEAT